MCYLVHPYILPSDMSGIKVIFESNNAAVCKVDVLKLFQTAVDPQRQYVVLYIKIPFEFQGIIKLCRDFL